MTPDQFKTWRKQMGFTQQEAAEALGISREIIGLYEVGRRRGADTRPIEIPKTVALACSALEAGLGEWSDAVA